MYGILTTYRSQPPSFLILVISKTASIKLLTFLNTIIKLYILTLTILSTTLGNEDIVNGNLKLILGLIWRLILTYQIKVKADSGDKNKASAKQLMMTWIQSIMPGCKVRNLNKDWNNGIPLCALVDHIKPGVCPQWTRLDPRNRLSNARLGMDIAKEQLGIPQVLSPEDLISPELDDLSMLTYLSYFTSTQDSPGYQEVLKFVNSHLSSESRVKNFSVDWKDGKALYTFVNAIYPGAARPPPPDPSAEQLINLGRTELTF